MNNQHHFKYILGLLLCGFTVGAHAQLAQRTSLGVSGSTSKVTVENKVYYISSSIGQQSVIGTSMDEEIILRQGYQQPPIRVVSVSPEATPLLASVFPNPVKSIVNINFGSKVEGEILSLLYDIQGREIENKIISPTQSFQIDMTSLSTGTYILKIRVGPNEFSTQLIKN
ncbi:MAG: T9SS type A sorting domain-containing protein [Bacteroidota bacterium]